MFKKIFGNKKSNNEKENNNLKCNEVDKNNDSTVNNCDNNIENIIDVKESVLYNDANHVKVISDKKEASENKKDKKGFLAKIKEGLSKTKDNFTSQFNNIFNLYTKIDDDLLDEIEEILITSDMGVELTMDIIDYIREEVKEKKIEDPNKIKDIIKDYLENMLVNTSKIEENRDKQKIILVVGVNGVGKTTSIGKISNRIKQSGKSVIVAAGDTFRAAAVEQLKEWCNRAQVDIIASENSSDPGSVIYDAIQAARARKKDVLICDTAGRLHNKVNLMNELSKIFKIVDKEFGNAQREVLLVVDATTGQNGLIQAKMFSQSCKIDGIVLTKLDGTAKGGIVFPIVKELNVPIKYIGVGEQMDDLQEFNPKLFVEAIFD